MDLWTLMDTDKELVDRVALMDTGRQRRTENDGKSLMASRFKADLCVAGYTLMQRCFY